MAALAMKSTKYIFFVEMLVSVPFLFQTQNILSIWLKEVPPYTVMFVQLMVLESLFNVLGSGFNTMSLALGKIKDTQVYGRLITLSILPLSYLVLQISPNPVWPMLVSILLTLAYSIFLVYIVNRYVHFGLRCYLRTMAWPIFKVIVLSYGGCWLLNNIIPIENKWLSCISYTIILCFYVGIIVFFAGIEIHDRKKMITLCKQKIKYAM